MQQTFQIAVSYTVETYPNNNARLSGLHLENENETFYCLLF